MALSLPETFFQAEKSQPSFYTEEELALLYQLENGLAATQSHEQVMENLKRRLGLGEKNEI